MTPMHSLGAWFARRAVLNADATALTFGAETFSYARLADRIARMAAVLRTQRVEPGDRIGYLGANHPDALVALFAATAIGAIFVPLNIRLSPAELEYIINDAGIGVLLGERASVSLVDGNRETLPCTGWIGVNGAGAGWQHLDALIDAATPNTVMEPAAHDGIAAIVYTSGTTGRPKGAILTHGNLWSNDLNWLTSFDISSSDVALIVAPVFHVSGLFVLTTTTLMMGGHVVLAPGFDAGAVIDAIERHRVTTSFGVPAMMLFLSEHPRFDSADLSSLRLYIAGGAPVAEPMLRRYAARGIPVSQCYGLSEVVSATVFLETASALDRLGSAGRAMLMAETRLANADGATISTPGERGEICVRGGNVSPGYWRNPAATAATIDADGWLHTGDIGFLDADNYLFVCDRVKDMIISGGENVYPAEIESVLFDHPGIANVSVIGRPDDRWGERVAAVAVLRPGHAVDLDAVQAFCAGRLARYKIPRELHLLDELPLNGSGKVVKTILRAQLAALEEIR